MIVCHCWGVNDRQIKALVTEGVEDVQGIGETCRAGTDCGNCHRAISRVVDGARGAARATPVSLNG